ncbi:MAG: MBL fold metallo-hydrolase [Candidatus Diapherotrites archaeon CG10_big_fil_rev_8_21_14_0_10_31_34]|nr:MAG: MBL fold metallo-hydrolase [Candidatus Diapherotrites archaeon CG10_big_fil_rev_8_21_14_0_10_31_34]
MSIMVKLKALGAAREVGRSSFLLDVGEKILFDRGIKLGHDETEYPMLVKTNLDAIVISHAHLDHSGNLPELFTKSNSFVYMTMPTLDLSKILWFDSLKIAKFEGITPEFSPLEIKKAEKYTFALPYRKKVFLSENTSLELFDAGHILGSSMVKVESEKKSVVYSGDYKMQSTRLFNGLDKRIGKADVLITESTYGDRNHSDRKELEKEFAEEVQETINRGGHAMIPAFAVGRSQELIDILFEHKVDAEIFFDGMGQKVARTTLEYPELLKNPKSLGKALHLVNWVSKGKRKPVLDKPSIIVTSAGMLEGGPIMWYLKKLYQDKNSKIFLTGYQVEGTNGRKLLEKGIVDIDGERLKVENQVKMFDFSAHASQDELIDLAKIVNPELVVCVHGDEKVINVFQKRLKNEGFNSVAPKLGQEIKLD